MMIPGDPVAGQQFGPGIFAKPKAPAIASAVGELESTARAQYIKTNGKRYLPERNDYVIGVVSTRMAEIYRVTLQPQSRPVRLGIFAFEGANKKNRPQLQVGDVVYGRIVHADSYTDADMECIDSKGKSSGFGPLVGGTLVHVSLGFARQLLFKGHPLLEKLGAKHTFEIAIGINGVIWLKTEDVLLTLEIAKLLKKAEDLSVAEALKLV